MNEYTTQNIRNVALAAHGGAGKTMLAEAMLHLTGAVNRLGRIEDGTTVSDFEEEEVRRGISLSTSVLPVEYKKHKINILDTPGFTDFVGEMISAIHVSEGVVIVVDAVAGAEVGTEMALNEAEKSGKPRFVVINKMNRDTANFQKALDSVQGITDARLIPIQLPWGEKDGFQGVVNLMDMKAYAGKGETGTDIPAEHADAAEEARMALVEAAAEGDDELLIKYLDGEELSAEEVANGLKSGVHSGAIVPVLVTAATEEIGVIPLLEALLALVPSPAESPGVIVEGAAGSETLTASDAGPLAAYVWKTTADPFVGKITYFKVVSGVMAADHRIWNHTKGEEERLGNLFVIRGKEQLPVRTLHAGDIGTAPKLNVTTTGDTLGDKGRPLPLPIPDYPNALYRVSVSPKTQADQAKMGPTLTRLSEEDMTLSWYNDPTTKQAILQGMGDQHLDVALRKAETKFAVSLNTAEPRIPYQETITRSGSARYRHKKQTGGAGQFGEVELKVEPSEEENYEFAWAVFGGAISNNYQTSIEKGVKSVMSDGVIAGYPVIKIKVSVTDGKEHPVDSKPVAFEIAARECFKQAVNQAGAVMLEPIMNVRVVVPEANMGDIMGDLNTRRARVQGMDTEKGRSIVTAHVPLAEMLRYTTDLRSMTGGRGIFSMEESHYEQVPAHLAQELIEAKQQEDEEE
ncbi:MAG TPA: elongation factor G [Anaerolineales bacterium]|nr:elongation factor G [Anaerolineales bacterium]